MLTNEKIWKIYENILLMRRFEERVIQLYQEKYIFGFCHPYIGQEAVLAGVTEVRKPGDTMITSYRCHAHMLASGATPYEVMSELTGRVTGCSKGKGGSMHMFRPEGGFYGGHGIVGAYVSLGTGLALAHQYKEDGGVTYAFFGDGGANQGQVFESFNMAALWKLPVVYVIENNGYGIGTSSGRSCAGPNLYGRGAPFGIPGQEADGMDVFDVAEKVQWATDLARSGEGPAIVEAATYRFRGHSVSDPANYRSKEEVNSMKARDPLLHLENLLTERKAFSEEQKAEIQKRVADLLKEVVERAKTDPVASMEELFQDVTL